jgi:ribonuclease E
VPGADQPELQPVYAGPTPADPFGGRAFDIFDVMDQVERAAEAKPAPRASSGAGIVNNTAPEPDASSGDAEPDPAVVEQPAAYVPEPSALAPETSEREAAGPEAPAAEASELEASRPDVPTSEVIRSEMSEREEPAPEASRAETSEREAHAPEASGAEMSGQEAPAPMQPEDQILNAAAPEPAGEALRTHTEQAASSLPVPANDTTAESNIPEPPPAEPLVKPILIGAGGEPPAEPKRGWWRR